MQKCSFCGEIYEFPRGLTYVTSEGKIFYFCKSKCRKNMLKLKRDRLKVKWVKNKGTEVIETVKNEKK
jgi:large subunit ribosomal protein L24e